MEKIINLIKLSVGTENVEQLLAWQALPRARTRDDKPQHITRMWPKREEEILNDGSIFWVIKGVIQCRQRILRLDEYIAGDGIRRCGIVVDPEMHRTETALKRPFQGWRYLKPEDSPADLSDARANEEVLPADLSAALADIGVR